MEDRHTYSLNKLYVYHSVANWPSFCWKAYQLVLYSFRIKTSNVVNFVFIHPSGIKCVQLNFTYLVNHDWKSPRRFSICFLAEYEREKLTKASKTQYLWDVLNESAATGKWRLSLMWKERVNPELLELKSVINYLRIKTKRHQLISCERFRLKRSSAQNIISLITNSNFKINFHLQEPMSWIFIVKCFCRWEVMGKIRQMDKCFIVSLGNSSITAVAILISLARI